MSRLILIGVVALTASACGTTDGSDSATTSRGVTSTIPSTTSTSSSTTTSSTSTTSTLPPTTTTTLLEGNWAEQPVVTGAAWEGVLGWWDGSRWVPAEAGAALPISGGEDYQIALLGSEAVTSGGKRVTSCEILVEFDFPGIELAEPSLLFRADGQDVLRQGISGVAISAPWDLTPREVTERETRPDLEAAAVEFLNERGYETESVVIVQVVEADLDGDGAIETIVVAEDTELAHEMSDVYSIVFALSPPSGEPIAIEESIIPAGESGFPASFRVSAVADLSGDGVMEVVLDGLAWENGWVEVYETLGDRFEARIGAGCGV